MDEDLYSNVYTAVELCEETAQMIGERLDLEVEEVSKLERAMEMFFAMGFKMGRVA